MTIRKQQKAATFSILFFLLYYTFSFFYKRAFFFYSFFVYAFCSQGALRSRAGDLTDAVQLSVTPMVLLAPREHHEHRAESEVKNEKTIKRAYIVYFLTLLTKVNKNKSINMNKNISK